jgi:integrase
VVPINDHLWDVLSSLPRKLHSPYVFAKKNGYRYHRDGLKKAFSRALKRAGIEDFRFHDLRHSAASNLVMAGVSLFTVSQLLGHRTLAMTERYSHLSPSHLSEAAQKLGRVLRDGEQGEQDAEVRAVEGGSVQ